MRLLYLIDSITNSGGMERIVIDKINYLADVVHYEIYLSYYGNKQEVSLFPISERIVLLPLNIQHKNLSLSQKLLNIRCLKRFYTKIVNEIKPDVIVNLDMHMLTWFLPFWFRNVPKVIELHFSYKGISIMNEEHFPHNRMKRQLNILLRKSIYPFYDRFVVLTNCDKKKWGYNNIEVIPNFTNLTEPDKDNSFPSNKTVVNVGRLFPQKNQSILLDAWKLVYQQEPDWTLEIWGEGKLKSALENKINSLGLNDTVFLKGVSTHIGDVYNRASFFVLSSKYEGLPLVLIEAMMFGLPVVCLSIDGTNEIVKDRENGYLVKSMTAEALAEAILKMIRTNDFSRISDNARKSAKAFNKENIMQKWIALFGELVKKT